MKSTSRIPSLRNTSFDGMLVWFAKLSKRGLLFHVDDDPAEIIATSTGERAFSDEEAAALRAMIAKLFRRHGNDVYEAEYPIFMNAVGMRLDA
jgi:hypothetical protein